MLNKNRLFLLTLAFLQTACTEQRIKPTVTPAPVHSSSAASGTKNTPDEHSASQQVPANISKPVAPSVSRPKLKPKPTPQSPAVLALLSEADKHSNSGDLASANVDLERALRISPQNAEVTYQLAVVRLKQSQFRLAENLGKKAVYLSANDTELKKRCWLLISKARELQGNAQGAQEALLKAESLE